MKLHVPPHMGVCLILCCVSPLHAQNLPDNHSTNLSTRPTTKAQQVSWSGAQSANRHAQDTKAQASGEVSDKPPVYTLEDVPRLQSKGSRSAGNDSSVRDLLDVLRKPAPDRRMAAAKTRGQSYEVKTNSLQDGLSLVASLYREAVK